MNNRSDKEYINIIKELCYDDNKSIALKACMQMMEIQSKNQRKTTLKWFVLDKNT